MVGCKYGTVEQVSSRRPSRKADRSANCSRRRLTAPPPQHQHHHHHHHQFIYRLQLVCIAEAACDFPVTQQIANSSSSSSSNNSSTKAGSSNNNSSPSKRKTLERPSTHPPSSEMTANPWTVPSWARPPPALFYSHVRAFAEKPCVGPCCAHCSLSLGLLCCHTSTAVGYWHRESCSGLFRRKTSGALLFRGSGLCHTDTMLFCRVSQISGRACLRAWETTSRAKTKKPRVR